jgi:hypothetical protein
MIGGRSVLLAASNAQLWTPAQLTTSLWLDGADSSTITTVSGDVSAWNDKSGNSRNVSQATPGSRPTLTTFNGLQAVLFDGSSDFLQSAASITTGTYTGWFEVVWVGTRSGSGGTIVTERSSVLVGTSQWVFVSNVGYISTDGVNASSNHSVSNTTFNAIQTGGGIVVHRHQPGARDQLFVNGTLETVTAGTASNITGGTSYFRIGAREGAVGQYWNGTICEVVVTAFASATFSTTNRQRIEGYLAHKWGLASLLPAGHPFKSAPPYV